MGATSKACYEVTALTHARFLSFILTQALFQDGSHVRASKDMGFMCRLLWEPWRLQNWEKVSPAFESVIFACCLYSAENSKEWKTER